VIENTIDGIMTAPTMYGIRFENSVNCKAIGNLVSDCVGAIHLENATNCVVERNDLMRNDQGIRMYSPCSYNRITANNVHNNTYDGMIAVMPPDATFFQNFIFHNNFFNNTNSFIYQASGNIWDDGYPSGGNYWSHYSGTDLYKGPYQNETGSDGIGDVSYRIGTDQDRYPLMTHFSGSEDDSSGIHVLAFSVVFATAIAGVAILLRKVKTRK
jgi:parallel beta-helix repeat protein